MQGYTLGGIPVNHRPLNHKQTFINIITPLWYNLGSSNHLTAFIIHCVGRLKNQEQVYTSTAQTLHKHCRPVFSSPVLREPQILHIFASFLSGAGREQKAWAVCGCLRAGLGNSAAEGANVGTERTGTTLRSVARKLQGSSPAHWVVMARRKIGNPEKRRLLHRRHGVPAAVLHVKALRVL